MTTTRITVATVVLSRPLALARIEIAADAGVTGDVELRGVGPRCGEAFAHDLLGPIHGVRRLQGHVRRGEADLEQRAAAVLAEQALAEERLAVTRRRGGSAGPVRSSLSWLRSAAIASTRSKVGLGERGVGAFDGEEDMAGEDVLGKGFFQELVAADAGTTGREETNVVVLGAAAGVWGDEGDADGQKEPGSANPPGRVAAKRPRNWNMPHVSPGVQAGVQ